ncbi:MAG: nucleotidyltransferase family protein [Clostridia bacterium]|nr:nucleotidyltransferase family protein [Clostridia bacterium]
MEIPNILITTIKSAITKTPVTNFDEQIDYDALFKLSLSHDLIPLVSEGLFKNGLLLQNETGNNFKIVQKLALVQFAKMEIERNKIIQLFSNNKIPFILLKGSVLNKYYPEKYLRTQGDIDILIPTDRYDEASCLLTDTLNCEKGLKGTHDITFKTPQGIHIELHFSLDGTNENIEHILNTVWENTTPADDNPYQLSMNHEFFLFYHIVHMAKHFKAGGIGIKAFLDLWIIKEKMDLSEEKVYALFEKAGLLDFYKAVLKLATVWFSDEEHTDFSKQLEDFVLNAGVFGTIETNVALSQIEKGGKLKHLTSRVFLTRKQMETYYPMSKKLPYLLPYYQIKRWFRIFFSSGRDHALSEIKETGFMTAKKQTEIENLYNKLNI